MCSFAPRVPEELDVAVETLVKEWNMDDLFYVEPNAYDHLFPDVVRDKVKKQRDKQTHLRNKQRVKEILQSLSTLEVSPKDERMNKIKERLRRKLKT
jgi:uncharacterized secreted protein with C-terminal beta-propeller domain